MPLNPPLLWYDASRDAASGSRRGSLLLLCLRMDPGPPPQPRDSNTPPLTRASPSPLLRAPPCFIHEAGDHFPALTGKGCEGWALGCSSPWARGSSPSFSHCELSARAPREHNPSACWGLHYSNLFIYCLGEGSRNVAWRASSPQPARRQTWKASASFPWRHPLRSPPPSLPRVGK